MVRPIGSFLALLTASFVAATANAAIIRVPAGGDLQQALNAALPGDTIVLAAGATYTGNFTLPAKNGTAYITIRTDAPDSTLPAAGQRITPDYAAQLPKLQAPAGAGGTPPLATAPYASYYVIQFVEFLPNPSGTGSLLALGSAESTQDTLAVVPHDIIVDRCYLHGYPGVAQLRGIALNSGTTTIRDSYISEIKAAGADSQAIAGWNGPGPYTIVNNYMQAAGEVFMLGGSSMFIPNTTPSNIEFRNNYLTKDRSWRGSNWTVKNIFELKHAQDVVVDGNVFENNWQAAQPGYAIVLTPRNQYNNNPWTVVQRVTFTNNIVRHVAGALNLLGWDDESAGANVQTNHLAFRNNVFEDVSSANWGGDGRLLLISEVNDVTVDHNTSFNGGNAVYAYYGIKNQASQNFVFTNNIVNTAYYGIMGDSSGGNPSVVISKYFPGSSWAGNLFVAPADPWDYPAGNLMPASWDAVGFVDLAGGDYHLDSTSPYKGTATDSTPATRKDPGADIDALDAALSSSTAPPPPPPPPPPSDLAPTVGLVSPASGATYTAGDTVYLNANAADGDSSPVSHVDFYANGTMIGTSKAATSPYTFAWSNVAAGTYSLTAVAVDTAGLQATSAAVAVSVTAAAATGGLPAPWSNGDVGAVGVVGSATYATGVFSVNGAGSSIGGSADSFQFVYRALTGDGQIVARLASMQNTGSNAQAGITLRESLAAGSRHATVDIKAGGGVEFLARATTNGSTKSVAKTNQALPGWLKLVRSGSTVTGYVSADGRSYRKVGNTTVSMAATIYVGLVVCSHNVTALNSSTFDSVSVAQSVASPGLPPPYQSQDIGTVGVNGSTVYSNGVFTVKGAGADIWGSADALQYAYKPLSGDGQLIVRVASEQNTDAYAKAGIDVRESLTAGSAHVIIDVKPGGEVEFMSRQGTGGSTSWLAGVTPGIPVWLKLARTGSTFSGYASMDGVSWTQVGPATTVSMASSVYIGMAVCSHNTSVLNAATFDNVK
ncbi:MAG: Ig-like domain-containing protein [Bacteroidales bacterium]